jgi:hypothetical protein
MKRIFASSFITFAVAMGLLKLGDGNVPFKTRIGQWFWPAFPLWSSLPVVFRAKMPVVTLNVRNVRKGVLFGTLAYASGPGELANIS